MQMPLLVLGIVGLCVFGFMWYSLYNILVKLAHKQNTKKGDSEEWDY